MYVCVLRGSHRERTDCISVAFWQPPTPKSSSGRVGEVKLESTLDFINLAKDLGGKLKKSKAGDVSTFLTEVLSKGAKDPLGVDHLEELISSKSYVHRLLINRRREFGIQLP